ncbi:MAG: hypothetical protein JO001_10125 [Alphaproteobacteria bacterium]|nr:hypothetical protein [Alphaproteobacteria bacterium]
MASVTGSYLQFLAPGASPSNINLVLTPDGTGATTVAGAFNIEIFTSTPGTAGSGFQAAAFVQGAQAPTTSFPLSNTEVQAGTISSTEQILSGAISMQDVTPGGEKLTAGSGTGAANETIIGASTDSLVGGSGSGQVLNGLVGPETITQGSGTGFIIFGGSGDTILAASASTGATGNIVLGSNSNLTLNPAGNYTISSATGSTIIGGGSAANSAITGAPNDLINLTGDSGNNTITGASGGDTIIAGSGTNIITGASGDSIVGGAGGSWGVVDAAGSMRIVVGTGGTGIIGAGGATSAGGADTITAQAGTATVQITGAKNDSINLSGNTGADVVTGAAGDTITAGAGNDLIVGAATDSIISGAQSGSVTSIVDSAGGMQIVIGTVSGAAGGVVIGGGGVTPGANDTIVSQANTTASITMTGGVGDSINLTGNSGAENITTALNDKITLGGGNSNVIASVGSDSITLGTTGGATIVGTAPTITGQAGDTIIANGASNLVYGIGASSLAAPGGGSQSGGDLINLIGSTATSPATVLGSGNATVGVINVINAFSTQSSLGGSTQYAIVNDTVMAGNNGTTVAGAGAAPTVFGDFVEAGGGDRIGVGSVGGANATVSGTHLWDHSTSVAGAAVQFGTNDSVTAVTYSGSTVQGQGASTRGAAGSTAQVTVTNFNSTTDSIFYQNETPTQTTGIIASAKIVSVQNTNSTVITLPDGTQMTLFGYTGALNQGMFKP